MKGAKRILSVFLLVVMLCTFFAFPAEAATNYWPSLAVGIWVVIIFRSYRVALHLI